jgi:phage gp36-like protein
MPYTTPAAYLQRFGTDEAVQLLADEEALLTKTLLLDAIAGSWTGSPSPEELAAAEAALARLERQLEIASNMMDGYLRSQVTLPIAVTDPVAGTLEECCAVLTRCGLADDSDNYTERMAEACKTWHKWLADVAARRVQLLQPDGTPPAATRSVRTGQACSNIPWDLYGGVR